MEGSVQKLEIRLTSLQTNSIDTSIPKQPEITSVLIRFRPACWQEAIRRLCGVNRAKVVVGTASRSAARDVF